MSTRINRISVKLRSTIGHASPAFVLAEADRARDARDWPAAVQGYASYLTRRPGDAAICMQLGHARKECGDLGGAAEAYRAALAADSTAHESRLHLAHCLKNAGHLDEAASEFRSLLEVDAHRDEAMRELAEALPPLHAARGDDARTAGDWALASAAYSQACALRDDQPSLWIQLAHARKETGQLEGAAEAYRRAAELAPDSAEPWLHMAHLFRRIGPREASVEAFARTWVLGYRSVHILEALRNAVGYRDDEVRAAVVGAATSLGVDAAPLLAQIAEPQAPAIQPATAPATGPQVLYLSGIDWGYRRQRPQQLARALGALGCQVHYISTVFDQRPGGFGPSAPRPLAPNVVEMRLGTGAGGAASLHQPQDEAARAMIGAALARLCSQLDAKPVVIVDHPAWFPFCETIAAQVTLLYDCLDDVSAMPGAHPAVLATEQRLVETADIITASAQALHQRISALRSVELIPNGVDHAHFGPVASTTPGKPGIRILYFGMIANWFEHEWVDHAARAHPEWTFQLAGEVVESAVENLRNLPNVEFLGEVAYERLPTLLAEAHAAIIPFRPGPLTDAVNPVKLYEYLAAGRPVVASEMPELRDVPGVRTTSSATGFVAALEEAIATDTPMARAERNQWAAGQDWSQRAAHLLAVIQAHREGAAVVTQQPAAAAEIAAALENPFPWADFVAFVAPFPRAENVIEGWMARIRAVDEIFADTARVYLHFSMSADPDCEPEAIRHSSEVLELMLHPLSARHCAVVERVMAGCRFCYVQTVHLARHVVGFLPTGKIVTDFHGIVPEEETMLGNPEAGRFYEGVECAVIHASRHIVVVTQSMADHLRAKYPSAVFEELVLPIIVDYPATLPSPQKSEGPRLTVIYSGGSQVWQNIDLMLDTISRARVDADYRVASHDHAVIRSKAASYGVDGQMDFAVYTREQLPALYAAADFGFVLRDDCAVNRVACPTKLTEYIEFGIIPIVKLDAIGDFASLGYEFVTGEEFAAGLIPGLEQRRQMIARNKAVLDQLRDSFARSAARLHALALPSRIAGGELGGLPIINQLGAMPWKREVYVFGDRMTYVPATFLKLYDQTTFHLPDGACGDLVRIVPMVGDFIANIEEVAVTVAAGSDVQPVVVQSRARHTAGGDVFSSKAPFLEVRLSAPADILAVDLRMRFIDSQPIHPALFDALDTPAQGQALTVTVHNGAGSQSRQLVPRYVR